MAITVDTETLGLCGPLVTVQYKQDDMAPQLLHAWLLPVHRFLTFTEKLMQEDIIGFNWVFDHFQLVKLYNMFHIIKEEHGEDNIPLFLDKQYLIDVEFRARDGFFLKPKGICDVMLQAQKGHYQRCMEREDIIVRKVPVIIADQVCTLLNAHIPFESILFRNKAKPEESEPWNIYEYEDRKGKKDPRFVNIKCKFKPSFALKSIAEDMGLVDKAKRFADIGIPKDKYPIELGFAPFAKAFENITEEQWPFIKEVISKKAKTKKILSHLELPYFGTWVNFLDYHVSFWNENKEAQQYALDDVNYTRAIFNKMNLEFNDDDSALTVCVANVRWKGFEVDLKAIEEHRKEPFKIISNATKDEKGKPIFLSPVGSLKYIKEKANPFQLEELKGKTGQVALENLAKGQTEAGKRANELNECRRAKKEVELCDKLLIAGRFHASFKIIGTLSSRMSGSDGLNPQGIKKDEIIRSKFPLAPKHLTLVGGDFSGFEVCIFEAVSNDPKLREELLSGKSIHAIFGTFVYTPMTYDEIMATKGTSDNRYTKSKSALFAMLYGGEAETLMTRLGVSKENAQVAYDDFLDKYVGARNERLRIKDDFTPLRQDPNSKIFSWYGHENYVESLLGFRRYFDIEFYACRKIYELSSTLFNNIKIDDQDAVIVRNDERGPQKVIGAAMSALFAAACNVQASVFRQAANHRIQSTGAQITKMLERQIWDLQPIGISEPVVMPMNVHDEVMCPAKQEKLKDIEKIVTNLLEDMKKIVPLIEMEWGELETWGQKK